MFLTGLVGCADDPTPPRPTPVVGDGKSDAPNGDNECREACKKLLVECSEQEESFALEDCQEQCQSSLLSEGELQCLSGVECGDPSDSCLGR